MAMPDAVDAMLDLAAADLANLTRTVYNITSFSLTAEEFRDQVVAHFPGRHQLRPGPEPPGHRRHLARLRRRLGGPKGVGLLPATTWKGRSGTTSCRASGVGTSRGVYASWIHCGANRSHLRAPAPQRSTPPARPSGFEGRNLRNAQEAQVAWVHQGWDAAFSQP
ncbi:MAG: hypothetical protein R3E97_07005 [Candidatus Eisenbacteria bacterium]